MNIGEVCLVGLQGGTCEPGSFSQQGSIDLLLLGRIGMDDDIVPVGIHIVKVLGVGLDAGLLRIRQFLPNVILLAQIPVEGEVVGKTGNQLPIVEFTLGT